MTQQSPEWDENYLRSTSTSHFDIAPLQFQYREPIYQSHLGENKSTVSRSSTLSASMQSLHSEINQHARQMQLQESQNGQDYFPDSLSQSSNHNGHQTHSRMASSSEHLPPGSSGRIVARTPVPYANSWHNGRTPSGELSDTPQTVRRVASSQEDASGSRAITPNGRRTHSRQNSAARSQRRHNQSIGADRQSSEQEDVYATAMSTPNLYPNTVVYPQMQMQHGLPYPPDDMIMGIPRNHYPSSVDGATTATAGAMSRASHSRSQKRGGASVRSPTMRSDIENMHYDPDGLSLGPSRFSPGDREIYHDEGIRVYDNHDHHGGIVAKEEARASDERSIATSGDGGDMVVRQDLRRQLHERHVGMIAFTGAIGIGLFLTSGRVLKVAGPGGAVLAYFLMGTVANSVMACLGEMTALISIPGPMSEFASRFVDDSLGFAVGWMFWFTHAIGLASETTAAAILMTFVYKNTGVTTIPTPETDWPHRVYASDVVWIAIFLILVLLINLLPVRIYGEFEYVFAWIKLLGIVALIFTMLVLNLRSTDRYGRDGATGFRYWSKCTPASSLQYIANCTQHPEWGFFSQAFDSGKQQVWTDGTDPAKAEYLSQGGDLGRLKSVWTALTLAFYAYLGMEIISVTAAESRAPALSIKTSTRKMFWRLATLYCLGMFVGSLNVPYTHPNLLSLRPDNSDIQGKVSPFIIAVVEAGVTGLPSLLNALFLFAAWSAGVSALFVSSRTMHAMALAGHFPWPKMKEVNRFGVPVNAMLLSWCVGFLSFLQSGNNAQEVLGYLVKLGTIACLIVYACISASYIRFFEGLRHRNTFSRRDPRYPYRSRFQPVRAWYGLVGSSLVIIFNGWEFVTSDFVGDGNARAKGFVFSYLAFFGFIVLYAGRKLITKSEFVPVASMDFAGARLRQDLEIVGKHWLHKLWDWIK